MDYRNATSENFLALATVIDRYNQTSHTQCIHGGEGIEAIMNELHALH